MSWKSFASVAVLAVAASPVFAQPTINLVDNMDGTATLQVTPDATALPGSVAVELAVEASGGLDLTGAVIADGVTFDTMNPGDNPYIPGSPIGGDATGIDLTNVGVDGNIFVAYGSSVITTAGAYDLLTINVLGSGTLTAAPTVVPEPGGNIVAQAAALNTVSEVSINIGGVTPIPGDFDMDGDVDVDDFGVFVNSFQLSPQGGPPFADGDFDEDGDVDVDDFGVFVNSFQMFPPPAVAVPEPSALVVALTGLAACLSARRSGC